MITVVAKLQAIAGKENELRTALEEMVANVREKEAGKVPTYSLHVSADDPTLFMFYEQYTSEEAFKEHGQTDHMKALGAKLAGLLAGPLAIERFTKITGV